MLVGHGDPGVGPARERRLGDAVGSTASAACCGRMAVR
ncbi:hypothetical protein GLE_1553 [Lysobacter enzymogenes]|uniref:Uncharacterized protein n=1 Tax=Lysobacter enzymogenes TaxID=69 RepID=A0A0S2DEU1_LYSEN|nr:hypothetical protein GLE_1553 [Lysobacter enzymogenes]